MTAHFDLAKVRYNFERAADVTAGNGVRQTILCIQVRKEQ